MTSAPAAGAAVPLDGAVVPLAGAAGVVGLELVHPASETATTTKIIASTQIGENFMNIFPVQSNYR